MAHDEASKTCPSCGARVPAGSEVCDLCGTPVEQRGGAEDASPEDGSSVPESANEGPYCHQCGWQNPPGARYCSKCGTRLQDVSTASASESAASSLAGRKPAAPPPSEEPAPPAPSEEQRGISRQVIILVGASLLLVVALFLLLVVSNDTGASRAGMSDTTDAPAAAMQGSESAAPLPDSPEALLQQNPLSGDLADQVEQVRGELEVAEGDMRRTLQQRLINLYIGAGRPGLAALEQERFAKSENTADAWATAGHLFYDWMQSMERPQRFAAAERAVQAYQRVLDQEPGNLDVRTAMATAYLESNNPMQGVQEIKQVLAEDPEHLQARFNYGIMLTMIGRTDDAIDQFERAKEIAGEGSPQYQRAEQIIQRIRQEGSRAPGS